MKLILEFDLENVTDAGEAIEKLISSIRAGEELDFAITATDDRKTGFGFYNIRYAAPFRILQSERSEKLALN